MERSTRLQRLEEAFLDSFTRITGLPIGFYRILDGRPQGLFSSRCTDAFEDHCKFLHGVPGGKAACEADHCGRASAEIQRGVAGQTLCHAGLYNEAIPVAVNDQVYGVLLYGQMLIEEDQRLADSLDRHDATVQRLGLSQEQANRLQDLLLAAKCYTPQDLEDLKRDLPAIGRWFETLIDHDEGLSWSIEKVAHEIQTRLQAVIANAENLAREYDSLTTDEQKHMLQEVLYTSLALATVVRSMGEEYLQDYYFRQHAITPMILEAKRLFEAEATARGIDIRVDIEDVDGHSPVLEMSQHHMQFALNNLVQNAVKYSFRSGPGRYRYVRIKGRPNNHGYELSIQNYGVGILSDEIAEGLIFQDNYQGRLTNGEFRTGSGKGLYVVQRVIARHQGTIMVTSVKKGSEILEEGQPHLNQFRVWLPYKYLDKAAEHG